MVIHKHDHLWSIILDPSPREGVHSRFMKDKSPPQSSQPQTPKRTSPREAVESTPPKALTVTSERIVGWIKVIAALVVVLVMLFGIHYLNIMLHGEEQAYGGSSPNAAFVFNLGDPLSLLQKNVDFSTCEEQKGATSAHIRSFKCGAVREGVEWVFLHVLDGRLMSINARFTYGESAQSKAYQALVSKYGMNFRKEPWRPENTDEIVWTTPDCSYPDCVAYWWESDDAITRLIVKPGVSGQFGTPAKAVILGLWHRGLTKRWMVLQKGQEGEAGAKAKEELKY